mmetsp:Transcript_9295/g.20197  ORF Transcript_9295/g.20197 Transcript_9295/m.20197 type:complete len:484 (-) Transcript_9295:141-1592(-)
MRLVAPRTMVRPSAAVAARRCFGAPALPAYDFQPPAYHGPSTEELVRIRGKSVTPSYKAFTMYKKPVHVTTGRQQYLYDIDGKRYLDAFGGICTVGVGHCHPHLNEALKKQLDKVWHTAALYLNDKVHEFSEKLLSTLPKHLTRVYFVNSGSEANDMAMNMARLASRCTEVVAIRNAYHGMGGLSGGLTSHHAWRHELPSMSASIKHVMCPDPYRGVFGGYRDGVVVNHAATCDPKDAASLYAHELRDHIQFSSAGRLGAFYHEGIQGVGGTVQFADGYIKEAYEIAREAGAVCVADEVQTGFGRLGTHFWGFQDLGVNPDIVVMAKSIGNGFPLAAVVCTEEIAEQFAGKLHFNTYGGNPMASAVGIANLEVIEQEGLQANCHKVGNRILTGWRDLMKKHEIIGDVRGKGLMLGMELVKDRTTKQPAKEELMEVFESCKDMGLLLGKGGPGGNVFRVKPPMCWTEEDADFCIQVMDEAFSKL